MKARWVFALAALLFCTGLARDRFDDWVTQTDLPPLLAETSVEVRDRRGDLLRAYTVEEGRWRLAVSLDAVDPLYIDMLLAYEDRRFYRHAGVDPRAILRAGVQALRAGRIVSGGSTLTMQVARLLENSGTGALDGKLRQARLALALERRLSKADILSLYLLHAPMGGNLEGVRAATRAYFGKEPKRLTPAEAALLVALPQAPASRRPDVAPGAARIGRDRVLRRTAKAGVLSDDVARHARRQPVPETRTPLPLRAAHLSDRSRAQAPARQIHRLNIDGPLQTALEALAKSHAHVAGRGLSAAVLVMDHRTGEIRASIGSPGLDAQGGHVDMTRALRSPGSTLKPLVYGLAFDSGQAHPRSLITDAPVRYGTYAPVNFDGAFRGDVTLARALQLSLNTPVVQLLDDIGPATLVASMRQAGMTPDLNGSVPGLAVSLGGVGVSLEDLVRLYAGLARGGLSVQPVWRLEAQEAPRMAARFLGSAAAWHVGQILSHGPRPDGRAAGRIAFKTGTSYGHRDTWAIGYDGQYVIGVWMGRPDGTAVPGAFGAGLAAPLLFEAFDRVSDRHAPLTAAPPGLQNWSGRELPLHLQRVGGTKRDATRALTLKFPPDGAHLASRHVTVKLAAGRPPYTIMINETPIVAASAARHHAVVLDGPGFHDLAVIDGTGAAVHAQVRVD